MTILGRKHYHTQCTHGHIVRDSPTKAHSCCFFDRVHFTALSLQNIFSCGRSNSDFEVGLGSISLLDEILIGQEWAKFLNPTQKTVSDNQRTSQQSAGQGIIAQNPQDRDGGQSSLASTQHGGGNYQGSFSGSGSSQNTKDFGMAPTSAGVFTLAGMDISEGNRTAEKGVRSEADQSEPMEHGHSQSDMQPEESGVRQQVRPPGDFSSVKVRYHLCHLKCTTLHQFGI